MNSSHPLWQRVQKVGRQARQAVFAYAVSRGLLLILTATSAALAFDFYFRFPAGELRWTVSLVWYAVVAASVWASLRLIRRAKWAPLTLANRLEEFFPHLRPQLSTAIDFLRPQPLAYVGNGSTQLRSAVVEHAWSLLQCEDVGRIIDRRQVRPIQMAALLFGISAIGAAVLLPHYTAAGLQRLLIPSTNIRWPQQHWLVFDTPPQFVTRGAGVELVVLDEQGSLPAQVTLQLRWQGENSVEQRPMQRIDERMVLLLDHVTRPFAYRAVGGDDYSQPWQPMEVVEPVKLLHGQLTIVPPDYLHRAPYPTTTPLKLPAGGELQWQGELETPVREVRVRQSGTSQTIQGDLATDQRTIKIPAADDLWQPVESGAWQLEVVDQEGRTVQGPTIEVQVIPDEPPTVRWSVEKEIVACPTSRVLLELLAEDDYAVGSVMLEVWHDQAASDQKPLRINEQIVFAGTQPQLTDDNSTPANDSVDRRSIRFELDLLKLPPLAIGSKLQLHVMAYDSRPAGEVGRPLVRLLQVVAADDLQKQLLQFLPELGQRLADAEKLQSIAIAQADHLAKQPELPTVDRAVAMADLAAIQQRAAEVLQKRNDGLFPILERWLQQWQMHRLQLPAAAQAWARIAIEGKVFQQHELADVYQSLAVLQQTTQRDENWHSEFADFQQQQQAIRQQLADWLRTSAVGEEETRLLSDLRQLRTDQAQLAEQTQRLRLAQLSALALGKSWETNQEVQDELSMVSRSQWELARRTDRLQSAVQALPDRLAIGHAFSQAALGTRLRSVARDLEQQRWTSATQAQTEAIATLDFLLALWQPEETVEATEQKAKTSAAVQQITQWEVQRQAALATWQDALAKKPDADQRSATTRQFSQAMRALSQEIVVQSGPASPLSSPLVQQHLRSATQAFTGAADVAQKDQLRAATAASTQGGNALAAAREAVSTAAAAVEQSALREALIRLNEQLIQWEQQQQALLRRTKEFDAGREIEDKKLSRVQTAELNAIAAEQLKLAQQVSGETGKFPIAVFQLLLQIGAEEMQAAAKRLEVQNSDATTQFHQQQALSQLQLLQQQMRAIQQEQKLPTPAENAPSGEPQDNEQSPRSAAELRLVLELQREILQKNQSVVALPADSRSAAVEILARQQQGLATLMRKWTIESGEEKGLLPLPNAPATIAEAIALVVDEVSAGEDIGTDPPPAAVRLTYRLELAALLLNDLATHSAALPLQQAIVQELEQLTDKQQQQRPASSQKTSSQQEPGEDPSSGDPDAASANSNTQEKPPTETNFDPQEIARLKQSIWGHLPPQVQEQLQQAAEAEFLPQYDRLIREYYRRLAEEQPPVP